MGTKTTNLQTSCFTKYEGLTINGSKHCTNIDVYTNASSARPNNFHS